MELKSEHEDRAIFTMIGSTSITITYNYFKITVPDIAILHDLVDKVTFLYIFKPLPLDNF